MKFYILQTIEHILHSKDGVYIYRAAIFCMFVNPNGHVQSPAAYFQLLPFLITKFIRQIILYSTCYLLQKYTINNARNNLVTMEALCKFFSASEKTQVYAGARRKPLISMCLAHTTMKPWMQKKFSMSAFFHITLELSGYPWVSKHPQPSSSAQK